MKKIFAIFAIALMLVATSCGNRQVKTDVATDSTAVEVVDSITVEVVDSTAIEVVPADTVVVETPAETIAE